jgi:hypothetical protein
MVISYIHLICWCMKSTGASTHPPSLNFCSSLSKAMQEMRGHTSVDTCLDLPNKLMLSYLTIPTYLMELWWNFSPCLGWLKDGTFRVSLLLSLFLKSIRENMIAMILWFLNIRHSDTLFGMWFLTSAQQLFLLILPSIG